MTTIARYIVLILTISIDFLLPLQSVNIDSYHENLSKFTSHDFMTKVQVYRRIMTRDATCTLRKTLNPLKKRLNGRYFDTNPKVSKNLDRMFPPPDPLISRVPRFSFKRWD
jgi:hypothetical protein